MKMGPQSTWQLSASDIALPRDLTEAFREILEDERFTAFSAFVAPSRHVAYRRRTFVVPAHVRRPEGGGWTWRRLGGCAIDLDRMLAAHLLGGAKKAPQRFASGKYAVLRALGLSAPQWEQLQYLSIDLDGQHGCAPSAVVSKLRERFGTEAVLVTSSSGREGRYRALVRLATPIWRDEAATRAKSMIRELGFPARSGAVEIFPAAGNTRLPFGLGGCRLFGDESLTAGHEEHPLVLAERLLSLSPITLPSVTRVVRATSSRPKLPREMPAARKAPASPPPAKVRTDDAVSRLWARGVSGYGERDEAIWILVCDCRAKGLSSRAAVEKIYSWIDEGGLNRSRAGKTDAGREEQKRDVERRVADAYRSARARPQARAEAFLTKREILDAAARADLAAPTPEMAAEIFTFLMSVLPSFKAARRGANIALPFAWWRKRGGERYTELRDASQAFELVEPHKAAKDFGPEAHSAVWRTTVEFDPVSPSRSMLPARNVRETPEYLFRRAKLLVTGHFPRELRARVDRWAIGLAVSGETHPAIADSVEEMLWRFVRERARQGAPQRELREIVIAATKKRIEPRAR